MALTGKFGALSTQFLQNKMCLYAAVRCYSEAPMPWNSLWSPGKYSEKNHDKMAEKYYLHPKEYQPYFNNERSTSDYPKLPMVGPATKDPYYPYDLPLIKKNYHETVHDRFEIMGEDRFSYGYRYRLNIYSATAIFFAVIISCGLITYLVNPYRSYAKMMEHQMPQKGIVHYSFEPADS